ncbi:MAG: hypothetical protein WCD18_26865 [Thermosynechococcaceae cyanobacterium]
MESTWLNLLGDWNPQFLRECRGRLKTRSITATIVLSLLPQILIFLTFWQTVRWTEHKELDWFGLWNSMTWFISYGLIIIGSYFLVNDITQEDRLGTLNFIRLSPRPGREILLGKLLGVPILPYLAVALTVPLHLIAGILGQIPFTILISFYIMLLAGSAFFFSVALLFGLLNSAQRLMAAQQSTVALGFAILLLMIGLPIYMNWNFMTVWSELKSTQSFGQPQLQWTYLPIASNVVLAHIFTLLVLAIGTFFIWRMLMRRFLAPKSTIMSKRLSYALVSVLEVLGLGFTLNSTLSLSQQSSLGIAITCGLNTGLFLVLIFVLCPFRQDVLDWLRFRYSHPAREGQTREQFSWRGAWRDLVWVDGSPGVSAIALNVIIANALIIPWMLLLGPGREYPGVCILIVVVVSVVVAIDAMAVQWIFTTRIRNPGAWAAGLLGIWHIIPVVILNLLGITPDKIPAALTLFTVFGYPLTNLDHPLIGEILVGLLLQCGLLGWLIWQLQRQFQRLTPH